MAFLSAAPFVKEEKNVEYYGGGVTKNTRDRITITVVYPCDDLGQKDETIPATRDTTVESPGTTCDLTRVSVGPGYADITGLCTIIYEDTTDWALVP